MDESASLSQPNQKLTGAVLQLARFIAIGGLNTALDFLLLNALATVTGIEAGGGLGIINLLSFTIALVHSYFWNRAWTFGAEQGISKTVFRAGTLAFLAVLGLGFAVVGARLGLPAVWYLVAIVVFLGLEVVLWRSFDVSLAEEKQPASEFARFLGVSFVGLVINSGGLALIAIALEPYASSLGGAGMVRNLAKALATGISLVWNFVGYKMFVFKK